MEGKKRRVALLLIMMMLVGGITVQGVEELRTPMVLTQEASTFSVTVPTNLPITVLADGRVIVADNLMIVNNSYGPVEITEVRVQGQNGWVEVPSGTDFRRKKVGLKEFTLQLKTGYLQQYLPTDSPVNKTVYDKLPLTYEASIATQKEAITGLDIAQVIFTVGWKEEPVPEPEPGVGEGVGGIYLAQDSDFIGEGNGNFRYRGTEMELEIPHTIKGVAVTSYNAMFWERRVTKVVSTNKEITDMYHMFYGGTSPTLDLSGLDTSSVQRMSGMFKENRAVDLNISTIDTKEVREMREMFSWSKVGNLDLGHFSTSNVRDMSGMFVGIRVPVLDVRHFDTGNVTDMSRMFSTTYIDEINVDNFDTRKVENMFGMFAHSRVSKISVRNFDVANVPNMSRMFQKIQVEELDLSSFQIKESQILEDMFTEAKITRGIARTQGDADRLNDTAKTGIVATIFEVR